MIQVYMEFMEKLLFTIPLVKYLFKNSQQFGSSELKKSCAKGKVLFILLFFLNSTGSTVYIISSILGFNQFSR